MKLAISNIAFEESDDAFIYSQMERLGFDGLEIAPTRIIPENPYQKPDEIRKFAESLRKNHGIKIVSMQSIWYGVTQKIFSSPEQRQFLVDYTCKAVDFAQAAGCKNLVFGCPRNRAMGTEGKCEDAVDFFRKVGDYAAKHDAVIAMEANPPIYNTDFINDDAQALELWRNVGSEGFKINLDMGTVICNNEAPEQLDFSAISHVHLSEPGLPEIKPRDLHLKIAELLRKNGYEGWVSIEMKKGLSREKILDIMKYAKEVFG